MLEIILIVVLSKKIAAMARERGRRAAPWVVMFVFAWVIGELGGAFAGGVLSAVLAPNDPDPNLLLVIGGALAGVVGAVLLSFGIVSSLPDVSDERYDDDEYDDRPRRRRDEDYDDDEEYDDRARRGR
jgi:hypothetical protein